MFAMKSRRTSSSRLASVRSSASRSTNLVPRRAPRTHTRIVASLNGGGESEISVAIGASDRRTAAASSTSSGCATTCCRTRPIANAPGEARSTLFEGPRTIPADSSTSSTSLTPSGSCGITTCAAWRPRRSARRSTTTTITPTAAPNTSATSTSQRESMALTLTRLRRVFTMRPPKEGYVSHCSGSRHLPFTLSREDGTRAHRCVLATSDDITRRRGEDDMREVFQQELQEVQERLVEIASLVARSIEKAVQAFNGSDVALAEEVISDDNEIDRAAVELDELAITILARQQPVARDLRIGVSTLRISASLERVGDMSTHIAQLARYRFPDKVIPKSVRPTFADMGRLDVAIANKLVELPRTENLALAEDIRNEDDAIDALHLTVFEKVLGEKWKGETVDTVDATLASRYHERFADHAVSIAKKVQYLATGDWVPESA